MSLWWSPIVKLLLLNEEPSSSPPQLDVVLESRAKGRPFPPSSLLLNQLFKRSQACLAALCLNSIYLYTVLLGRWEGHPSLKCAVLWWGDGFWVLCADLLWHGRVVMIMQTWPLGQSIHSMSQLRLLTLAGEWGSLYYILAPPPIHVSQELRREMPTFLYSPSDKHVEGAKLSVLNLLQ